MVCATILGIAIHLFPYSPRWLCLVGREDDSLKSLGKLRRLPETDERIQIEWRGIMAEVEFQRIVLEKAHPGKTGFGLEIQSWLDLFRKKTIRRTAVGAGVAFFQQVRLSQVWFSTNNDSSLELMHLSIIQTFYFNQLVKVMKCL